MGPSSLTVKPALARATRINYIISALALFKCIALRKDVPPIGWRALLEAARWRASSHAWRVTSLTASRWSSTTSNSTLRYKRACSPIRTLLVPWRPCCSSRAECVNCVLLVQVTYMEIYMDKIRDLLNPEVLNAYNWNTNVKNYDWPWVFTSNTPLNSGIIIRDNELMLYFFTELCFKMLYF